MPDHRKVTAINKMEKEENRTAGPKRNKSTQGDNTTAYVMDTWSFLIKKHSLKNHVTCGLIEFSQFRYFV